MSNQPTTKPTATGHCLCGSVQYEVHGPLRSVIACHCEQCRRASGHFVAATAAHREHLTITQDDGLRWYKSSAWARRGFCQHCGSNLFWEQTSKAGEYSNDDIDHISIMAGTLDKPTGIEIGKHIFTEYAGDYYTVDV